MNSRTAHGTVIMTIDEMMIVLYKLGNFTQNKLFGLLSVKTIFNKIAEMICCDHIWPSFSITKISLI